MSLFPQKFLFEEIPVKLREYRLAPSNIPNYIIDNLRYPLFKWQEEAFFNFFDYLKIREEENDNSATHLLFNMATGTGKTLLMAGLILHYFSQGKNKFIFFVNQNNIVAKTEENLTNPLHNKYLFKSSIVINGKTISVKKVDTFSNYDDDIQILFTTIHSLHNSVYKVQEDSVFLEQLQKEDIIMLADEAHHLNADTKKKNNQIELDLTTQLAESSSQELIEKSWEHTVINLILYKGRKATSVNNNVLLEFTATIPSNERVLEKYISKTLIRYDLKNFLKAGYTKEINLVSSSFDKRKRILQALLFNWYRNEIALKYNIPNFKPVILFRSKFIDKNQANNSADDYDFFINLIDELTINDFNFLADYDENALFSITELYKKGQSRIVDIKRYLADNNKTIGNIVTYLKGAFTERNCIITNSKKGTRTIEKTDSETDKLLNSLEDKDNHIRAIFTVQRLTEGWDVLNLFDIVRLYDGQNSGGGYKGKAGNATTSEVQLIGRGVRYFPFEYEGKERNKRKFDSQLNNELRVLEEFYFHSDNNEKYLSDLKMELKRQDLLPENDRILKRYRLKNSFINDNKEFYESIKLFGNERLENPNKQKRTLDDIKEYFHFGFRVDGFRLNESTINFDDNDKIRYNTAFDDSTTSKIHLKNIDLHLVRKAVNVISVNENSVFRFENLEKELKISSIDDLLSDNFLGKFSIDFIHSKHLSIAEISNYEKLQALIGFLNKLSNEIKLYSAPYIGSDFKSIPLKQMGDWYKEKSIVKDAQDEAIESELLTKPWYIYNGFSGTSEERSLIVFLKDLMGNFEKTYDQVFLLRNEEVYKIYDFEMGRGFEPDFILFLKSKNVNLHYQVFIEPKGSQFKDSSGSFIDGKEGWKEAFLDKINTKYGNDHPILNIVGKDYKLLGLPLYNEKNQPDFRLALESHLKVVV